MHGEREKSLLHDGEFSEQPAIARLAADKMAPIALQQKVAHPFALGEDGLRAQDHAVVTKNALHLAKALLDQAVVHVMQRADEKDHVEAVVRKRQVSGVHDLKAA